MKRIFLIIAMLFTAVVAQAAPPTPPSSGSSAIDVSGTPSNHYFAVWTDADTLKGVSVTASKVVCTNSDADPVACTNLTDVAIPSVTRTEVDCHASGALSAANLSYSTLHNVTQAADVTMTLAAATAAFDFNVLLGVTDAHYFRLDPDAGDSIYLDGTSCTDGKYVGLTTVAVGDALSCKAIKTGSSSYDIFCSALKGSWTCEP